MVAGTVITVIVGLLFLGGVVGGSFADIVIASPLDMATYSLYDIEQQACKNDGWQDLETEEGEPFSNQGQCVSYAVHWQQNN